MFLAPFPLLRQVTRSSTSSSEPVEAASAAESAPGSETRALLSRVAREFGTPCYAYLVDDIVRTIGRVRDALEGRFEISYAVKCNPNRGLLEALRGALDGLDVSSAGEIERGLEAGYDASSFSFSGRAKRPAGARAGARDRLWRSRVRVRVGARTARPPRCGARPAPARVLLRINPRSVPRHFGIRRRGARHSSGSTRRISTASSRVASASLISRWAASTCTAPPTRSPKTVWPITSRSCASSSSASHRRTASLPSGSCSVRGSASPTSRRSRRSTWRHWRRASTPA